MMDVPRRDPDTGGIWLGWRGELKRYRNGKPSEEQEDWLAFHRSQGYFAEWHKGYEAMWENLLWYLKLPRICPAPAPRPVRLQVKVPRTSRKPQSQKPQSQKPQSQKQTELGYISE